jgi:hypothetical protein
LICGNTFLRRRRNISKIGEGKPVREGRTEDRGGTEAQLAACTRDRDGDVTMTKGFEFEHISIEDAKEAVEKTARPGSVKDEAGERLPTPPVTLHPATVEWLAALPVRVRPTALAREFP